MEKNLKLKIGAFVSKYNRVCGRHMFSLFEGDTCYIFGEDIFSSAFLSMFDEAFPEKPFEYYIGIRGTSLCMFIY